MLGATESRFPRDNVLGSRVNKKLLPVRFVARIPSEYREQVLNKQGSLLSCVFLASHLMGPKAEQIQSHGFYLLIRLICGASSEHRDHIKTWNPFKITIHVSQCRHTSDQFFPPCYIDLSKVVFQLVVKVNVHVSRFQTS